MVKVFFYSLRVSYLGDIYLFLWNMEITRDTVDICRLSTRVERVRGGGCDLVDEDMKCLVEVSEVSKVCAVV